MRNIQDYYQVNWWMVSKDYLHLKGMELTIYAIIYGFTRDGTQECYASLNYFAEWTGSTKRNIQPPLKRLIDKGLIEKKEESKGGVKFCYYKVCLDKVPQCENHHGGWCENHHGGGVKITPNNIEDNLYRDNKYIYKGETKKRYGELDNVLLTDSEYRKIVDTNKTEYIDKLSLYIASKGDKYKSHYATILAWSRNENKKDTTHSGNTKDGGIDLTGFPKGFQVW